MCAQSLSRPFSRRDFLRTVGLTGSALLVAACIPAQPGAGSAAPAADSTATDLDLTNADAVGKALEAEGAEVSISSWGWSGLPETHFIPKFAEHTKAKYGVAVKLNWVTGVFDNALRELPVAGKTVKDIGLDVIDKEEESFDAAMALEWYEPINLPAYAPLLPNLEDTEHAYLFRGPEQDGVDIYGAVYQGYEWLQAILRKDKVDVSRYQDWTDLADPELRGKMIDYAFNDSRGHYVFGGFVNELVNQGKVPGTLWSEEAWEGALQWWKDNAMEEQILKWGDIGNDPDMRLKLQSGEAYAGCTWGVYTRELLGTDWNKRDDVLAPFYPKSGILSDRETLSAVRGAAHPVAARVLINWMLSTEVNTAGWYKEAPDAEAINHWNVTESQFLVAYAGGCRAETRKLIPDWAKAYHPEDPGSLIVKVDWPWYNQHAEWISKSYERIVLGNG
ncbi:MAG: twin-arginine translocation signal domain-containing protein [Caldilineaceae bacterium]